MSPLPDHEAVRVLRPGILRAKTLVGECRECVRASGFAAGVLGNVGLIMLCIGVFGPGTKSERLWCLFSGVLHLAVTYFIYRRASESWRRPAR